MSWSFASGSVATGSPGGSTSYNLAYGASTAASSTLIAVANSGGSTDGITVTGGGLTWTRRVLFSGTWAMWEAPNAAGGSITVNFANGSGTFGGVGIYEFDGGSGGYDNSGSNSGSSNAPSVSGFNTTSGGLIVASLYPVSGATLSGTGLTDTGTKTNGVNYVLWGTSSGTTTSFSGSLSFSDSWSVGVIVSKVSGGAARALFAPPTLSGLGGGGSFFHDRSGS